MDAHLELVLHAAKEEEKQLKQREKLAEFKAKMERARVEEDTTGSGVPGMKIAEIVEEEDLKEEETDAAIVKPRSVQKKTKAQRNKELKLLSEVWWLLSYTITTATHIVFRNVHWQKRPQIGGSWLPYRLRKV